MTLKEWYDIKAPSIFQVRNPGKTLVTRTKGTSESLRDRLSCGSRVYRRVTALLLCRREYHEESTWYGVLLLLLLRPPLLLLAVPRPLTVFEGLKKTSH